MRLPCMGKHLFVRTEKAFLLPGKLPYAACDGMVAVPFLKLVPGES